MWRLALVAAVIVGGGTLSTTACFGCDLDRVRDQVRADLGEFDIAELQARDGIVAIALVERAGEGRIGIGLHAVGTQLFTSVSGRDVDNALVANVGGVLAGWANQPSVQAVLSECGEGFAGGDPSPVLQQAVDEVLAGHGHVLRSGTSPWAVALAVVVGLLTLVLVPSRWQPYVVAAVATLATVLPLARMVVQTVGDPWVATTDQAIIELRTRDVGTADTPLVGAYSRYRWNHPGPLLFYAYAVPYRLAGEASWALMFGAGLLNLVVVVGTLRIAWRNGGAVLGSGVALGLALLVAGLNADCVDPWNPFAAVLPFALVIASAWAATEGDAIAVVVLALVGSFVVQSHVGYSLPVAALWLYVLIVMPPAVRRAPALLGLATVVLAACWGPVLYDQLFGSGNISALLAYFASDRLAIGWQAGLGIWAREMSLRGP